MSWACGALPGWCGATAAAAASVQVGVRVQVTARGGITLSSASMVPATICSIPICMRREAHYVAALMWEEGAGEERRWWWWWWERGARGRGRDEGNGALEAGERFRRSVAMVGFFVFFISSLLRIRSVPFRSVPFGARGRGGWWWWWWGAEEEGGGRGGRDGERKGRMGWSKIHSFKRPHVFFSFDNRPIHRGKALRRQSLSPPPQNKRSPCL